jgi:hypothetical protein
LDRRGDMRFKVKNTMVLAGLLAKPLDRRLVMVILWWLKRFGFITITESFRKQLHKNDLHGVTPLRAIDIRSWEFPNPQSVADEVNKVWIYDPQRPNKKVVVYHENRMTVGKHFHIQVHPNTTMGGD